MQEGKQDKQGRQGKRGKQGKQDKQRKQQRESSLRLAGRRRVTSPAGCSRVLSVT